MYIITSSGNRYEDLINAVSQTDQLRNFFVEIENRYNTNTNVNIKKNRIR